MSPKESRADAIHRGAISRKGLPGLRAGYKQNAVVKLFYAKGTCSLAPHIALEEIGDPYESHPIEFAKEDHRQPDFLELNPMGAVPVLIMENGQPLTEVAVVLQYLADLKPESGLAPPAGTLERYRLQERLNFVATELHKGFSPLFNLADISPDAEIQADLKNYFLNLLSRKLEIVNNWLGQTRSWFLPSGYSVADGYLFVVLSWSRAVKLDLARWPEVAAFMQRMRARPAVQKAMSLEGVPLGR